MFSRSPATLANTNNHRSPTINLHFDRLNFRSALVIEESTLLRGLLVDYLKKRGWIAHGTRRVQQALPLLKCIPYHLIVADSNLSGGSAINFAHLLRHSEQWSTIPLVLITDSARATFVLDRNAAGAHEARRSAWTADLATILADLEGHCHWKRENYAN